MPSLFQMIMLFIIVGFSIGFLVYVYYKSTSVIYFIGVLIVMIIFTIIPFIIPMYYLIFRPKINNNLTQTAGK